MSYFIFLIFALLTPLGVSYLCYRFSFLGKIGPILICYAIGLAIGHSSLISPDLSGVQETLTTISVPLALALLLFGIDLKNWLRMARKTLLSFIIALIALILMVTLSFLIFKEDLPQCWKICGMLVGIYTGGTPNLASIQKALTISPDIYIGVHTFDTLFTTLYLGFLLSFGKPLFRKILPKYPKITSNNSSQWDLQKEKPSFKKWVQKSSFTQILKASLLSLAIVAISGGIGFLFPQTVQMPLIIMLITTLALSASFSKTIRQWHSSYHFGMYLVYVFSLVLATMANFHSILELSSSLLMMVGFVLFGTFFLHVIGSKVLKVDADTMMVTSTALICSPPFVPIVAGNLKNKEVMISGLTTGIIGYAIGNYLGISIAYFLKWVL